MKKLSFILAVLTVLSLVFTLSSCGPATALDTNGIEYTFDNSTGTYVLSDASAVTATSVTIPATLEDSPVKIGAGALKTNTTIETLTIEEGVAVEAKGFESDSIKKIVLPKGFKLEGAVFENCTALEEVVFPSDITSLPSNLFKGCTSLKSLVIPEGVEEFGAILEGCTSIESITLPGTLTTIYGNAFQNVTTLKEVHITDLKAWCNMNFVDNGALSSGNNPFFTRAALFVDGKQVTDLVIPDGVTEIKPGVFNGASGIKSVTVPASVKKIGHYAFAGCADLETVNLTNGLEQIAHNAFAVTALKTLTIPASVTYVGENVVVECQDLTNVYFQSTSNWTTWMYSTDTPVSVSDSQANAELMKSYDNYRYEKKN